jgi:ADP-ribosyltransferase exoenzyme
VERAIVPVGTEVGERLIRVLLTGDAPHEPQMTGFRVGKRALKGASPRSTFNPGRQVDPLGQQFELSWTAQVRGFGRDSRALGALNMIRDLDPQTAQAVWNFLRLANPGMNLTAMVGGAGTGLDEEAEQGEAQAYLDTLMQRVGEEYGGGGDQLHNVLTLSLITNGAVACEVAPTEALDDVVDWYPIEPILVAFRREMKTHKLIIGQRFRDGTFADVNGEQVFHVPLDPDVEDPYGRPPLLSAVASVMAKAAMLNDIRAAAHNAGYPRIDVEVLWSAVTANAPSDLRQSGNEKQLAEWAEAQLDTLVKEYESMQVDDTFVHYDWVKITSLTANGTGFDFGKLDEILTRQVNSALKTLPILLGINESSSETHGSVQWNIQVAAIDALTRIVKRLIEKLGNVSLQLAGYQAHCKLSYDPIRTIDRLTEAQAETFEFSNLKTSVAMGWRTNDQAADKAVGHGAVGEPIPNAFGPVAAPAAGPTTPASAETAQSKLAPAQPATQAAWDLLRATGEPDWSELGRRNARAAAAQATREHDRWLAETSAAYGRRGRALYETYALVALQPGVDPVMAFATGYRSAVRDLVREALNEGAASERTFARLWLGNRDALGRVASEVQAAIVADLVRGTADLEAWVMSQATREEEMVAGLARQALTGNVTAKRVRARKAGKRIDGEKVHLLVVKYADRASHLFQAELNVAMALLQMNGRDVVGQKRDLPSDIADETFGLGYRRQMKGILRDSVKEGLTLAGSTTTSPEALVRRIWATNQTYIAKIHDDLAAQIRAWEAQGPVALDTLATWFAQNDYRERMMGEYLAKQGINAGFVRGCTTEGAGRVFVWNLGQAEHHCTDCLERDGLTYTEKQLLEMGMPGSSSTACGSQCQCSIDEEVCSPAAIGEDGRSPARPAARSLDWVSLDDSGGSGTTVAFPGFEDVGTKGSACSALGPEQADQAMPAPQDKDLAPQGSQSWLRAFDDFVHARMSLVDQAAVNGNTDAIKAYTSSAGKSKGVTYKTINGGLRGAKAVSSAVDSAIQGLDKAMAYEVRNPVTVFRSVNADDLMPGLGSTAKRYPGTLLREPGFTSTSLVRTASYDSFGGDTVLEIRLPAGTRCLSVNTAQSDIGYLGDLTAHPEEREIILARGAVYRLDSVETMRIADWDKHYGYAASSDYDTLTVIRVTVVDVRPKSYLVEGME